MSQPTGVSPAEGEYEKFRVLRDREYVSDFEKQVKQIGAGQQPEKEKSE